MPNFLRAGLMFDELIESSSNPLAGLSVPTSSNLIEFEGIGNGLATNGMTDGTNGATW